MLRAAQSAKRLGPRNTTWAKCSLPLPMRFKLLALIQLMQLWLTRVISEPPPGCRTASGAFGRSQGLAPDLRGPFFFSSRHFGNKIVVLSSPLSSPAVLVNPQNQVFDHWMWGCFPRSEMFGFFPTHQSLQKMYKDLQLFLGAASTPQYPESILVPFPRRLQDG